MYKYKQDYRVYTPDIKPTLKMNYIVALPEDYASGEALPMLVFLHGAGERGSDINIIKNHGLPKFFDTGLPVRAVVLAPQVPDFDHVWNNIADETFELIEKTAEEFGVDRNRISLTGISMGGYGTWELGMMHSDYFSALAPICGGGMSWKSGVLRDMPIRTFHGDSDSIVPISATYEMVDAIRRVGGKPQMIILHAVSHESWVYAYESTDLIEWLVSQKRENKE